MGGRGLPTVLPRAPCVPTASPLCPPTGTKCLQLPPAPMGLPLTGTNPPCVGGSPPSQCLNLTPPHRCLVPYRPPSRWPYLSIPLQPVPGRGDLAGARPDHDGCDPRCRSGAVPHAWESRLASCPSLKLSSARARPSLVVPGWEGAGGMVPTGKCGAGAPWDAVWGCTRGCGGLRGVVMLRGGDAVGPRCCVGLQRCMGLRWCRGGAARGHVGLQWCP